MGEQAGSGHCAERLAFFGRIGADVSHEMRNVLSVIGEYAGLLDDLLALAKGKAPLDHAKLKELSAKIAGQVRKGTEAMERFSRFAHAAEERTASCDLTSLTRNMAALAQRHVTLAGCRLEAEVPDRPVPVKANPFSLQHLLFGAIELILESREETELVAIKVATQGSAAVISVSGGSAAGSAESSGRLSLLRSLVTDLKGTVETSRSDGMLSLRLTIPTE